MRALATLGQRLGAKARLSWGLGGGADFVDLAPTGTATDTVTVEQGRLLTFAILRAAVGLELRAWSNVSIWSRLAADFDFSGTSYVFERSTGEELVLRPWPVRPALAAGVAFP
jgi:hypothetical protein